MILQLMEAPKDNESNDRLSRKGLCNKPTKNKNKKHWLWLETKLSYVIYFILGPHYLVTVILQCYMIMMIIFSEIFYSIHFGERYYADQNFRHNALS